MRGVKIIAVTFHMGDSFRNDGQGGVMCTATDNTSRTFLPAERSEQAEVANGQGYGGREASRPDWDEGALHCLLEEAENSLQRLEDMLGLPDSRR